MSNNDWIKPSDRLPDDEQHLLVTTDAGFIDTGCFYGGNWYPVWRGE